MERQPQHIEVSPESEFARHAEMIRLGLQKSVEDGFMSPEKADEWFMAWLSENKAKGQADEFET